MADDPLLNLGNTGPLVSGLTPEPRPTTDIFTGEPIETAKPPSKPFNWQRAFEYGAAAYLGELPFSVQVEAQQAASAERRARIGLDERKFQQHILEYGEQQNQQRISNKFEAMRLIPVWKEEIFKGKTLEERLKVAEFAGSLMESMSPGSTAMFKRMAQSPYFTLGTDLVIKDLVETRGMAPPANAAEYAAIQKNPLYEQVHNEKFRTGWVTALSFAQSQLKPGETYSGMTEARFREVIKTGYAAMQMDPTGKALDTNERRFLEAGLDAPIGQRMMAELGVQLEESALAKQTATAKKIDTQAEYRERLGQAQTEFLAQKTLTVQSAGPIAAKWDVLAADVIKAAKDPNRPLVEISQKQEGAEAATVGTGFGKFYNNAQEAGAEAGFKIAKLDRMTQLLAGVRTGKLVPTMTQIQALAEGLGYPLDPTLPAKQAFLALSNEIALELRNTGTGNGMPGQMSDKDREFLVQMTPNLSLTPKGNQLIIETRRKLLQRQQEVAKLAREYRKQHKAIDEGFYDVLEAFANSHPMFQGNLTTLQSLQQPATAGETSTQGPSGLSQLKERLRGTP